MVGVLFAGGAVYLGVQKLYVGTLARQSASRIDLNKKVAKAQADTRKMEAKARSLEGWAALTYDRDELRASAKIGAALAGLVERAGLNLKTFSLQPVQGMRVRGAYREIGRNIRVRGKLQNVVDFLYLLRQEPHLHRLENLSISPLHKTGEVDLSVRYVTVVIDDLAGGDLETDKLATTAPTDLDSEQRKLFDSVVSRDLFRPYIQRRVERVVVAPPPPRRREDPPPPPPNPGRFRVVGLPELNQRQEVLVSDIATGQLRSYEAGDTLGGGTIAMVDYRPLPRVDNPQMLSPSRVIFRVGPDYWAVELGQSLTQKRRLPRDQLPEKIRSLPETVPADRVKKNAPAER
jgi:hypothetical protein